MTCNIIKKKNGIAFVCTRGNSKLNEEDERKINEIIKNISKKLKNNNNIEDNLSHKESTVLFKDLENLGENNE